MGSFLRVIIHSFALSFGLVLLCDSAQAGEMLNFMKFLCLL